MDNLVEIDRVKITTVGNSPYILVPKRFRREPFMLENGQYLYEAVFLQAPNSDNVIIRIEKIPLPKEVT